MAGPFQEYSPPGVYTETKLDPAVVGLLGNLRVPALIGVADETKTVEGYDIARGSSATRDQKKVDEKKQGDGTTKAFTVLNFPLVKGDNSATITNNPNDVVVKVDGTQVIVAKVNGSTGLITLALAPANGSLVELTYFYKKTDTKVVDENISIQADGVNKTFYTAYAPIVDGSNAGKTTTNVIHITVKVNNSVANVSSLNGSDGSFVLSVAPLSTDTVTVTYYWNSHANTSDDLPYSDPIRMIRVGLSPETADYIESVDYAIIGDSIVWGTGYKLVINEHTTGSEFLDDSQIVGQTVDDKIYNEDVSSQFLVSNKIITTKFSPIVDGNGKDLVTEDTSKVIVKVNGTQVAVARIDGDTGKIYLKSIPAIGATVLVTYWRSRMEDDTYTIEVVVAGTSGSGTYKVISSEDGQLGIAIPGTENVASASFTGANWFTGPTVSKGYTIDETVTLTFTSNTEFTVTSSVVSGSSGTGTTDETYVDSITGLMFTLSADPLYAAADTLEIDVTKDAIFVTSTIPITSVPGMNLIVDNTEDTSVGDSTNLITFDKSGKEPAVGETYYVTYEYNKSNYECKVFTKFKNITNEYGDLSAENPLVFASNILFMNGAIVLITCQTKRATNSEVAADQSYFEVIDRLKYPVSGVNPAVIFPVTTSKSVIEYTSQHCNVMSSKRMRRERISFFGFAVGTEPLEAANYAATINSERMVALYPDGAVTELIAADGTAVQNVVDGSFLAAALIGVNVSTAYDVAEPMTRKQIVGFKALIREMDEATMDMVATKGVTVIMGGGPFVVRHCLTTRMESTLTRELNITTIRDYTQQESRRALDGYIGRKFVSNLTSEVETSLAAVLQAEKDAQIIDAYKGVSAERDSAQPDFIRCSAYYRPIVGLNWIEVVFNIRIKF